MSYKPFIYKLPKIDTKDIYNDVLSSSHICVPLFSLGFHSFIHRTKSALSITSKLETKNKFYYVINPFEHSINDYDKDIKTELTKFLNIKKEFSILSRAFYKMWDILYTFNLADNKNMVMIGLAEGHGSFIQAFIEFRNKYIMNNTNTIYGMTINKATINTDHINSKIHLIKDTYEGDMTKVSTIHYLQSNIKHKADLITADGGYEWVDKNFQEQEAYVLILSEIIAAISNQAKNGSFVLKVYESFTPITIKLIYILSSFYEETYIYKPYFSRYTNSEKYVICKGFKYDTSQISKEIKMLEETLNKCNIVTNKSLFIVDMFSKLNISQEHLNIFKYININIANTQQIMINNLVVYIKSNNYFGDMYHSYRDKQISANKWWIENFLTDKYNDKSTLIKDTIKYNESELKLFEKNIII